MADLHVVSALRAKRDELNRIIVHYEAVLAAAKRDLINVNATLALFEKDASQSAFLEVISIARMFKRGEIFALCRAALTEANGELDTRELAIAVMRAKGMNEVDSVLRMAIGFRVVRTMLRQEKHGMVSANGKRRGVRVWLLMKKCPSEWNHQ
ncbi:MAG TPA: hypothetical protein VEK34_14630 [Methylocella sp.]|nr:hypothetical protein [Methylocella sp.]